VARPLLWDASGATIDISAWAKVAMTADRVAAHRRRRNGNLSSRDASHGCALLQYTMNQPSSLLVCVMLDATIVLHVHVLLKAAAMKVASYIATSQLLTAGAGAPPHQHRQLAMTLCCPRQLARASVSTMCTYGDQNTHSKPGIHAPHAFPD
jgi:hypothetical protein